MTKATMSLGAVVLVVGLLVSGCWGSDLASETDRLGVSLTGVGVRIDYRVCEGDTIERISIEQSDGDHVAFEEGDVEVFRITGNDVSTLQDQGYVVLDFGRMEKGVSLGKEWFVGVYTADVGEIFYDGFTLIAGDGGVRVEGRVLSRDEFDGQVRESLAGCG